MDKMREQFEAALRKHYRIEHAESFRAGDDYTIPSIQAPWLLWNSALASVSAGQEKPVAYGAFYTGGNRAGKLYAHCETQEQISDYIAQVHQSNDSITLTPKPLFLAPPSPQQGAAMLQPDDLKALQRFFECCEDFDSGGHDVNKERMARLHELGVVQSKGFGRHQITAFGDYVLCLATNTPASFPLKTFAEYNENARIAHEAKIGLKPNADCNGEPANCPDNEGHGCACDPMNKASSEVKNG